MQTAIKIISLKEGRSMGFTRRTSGAVGVWVTFMVCGVHQAVAGGDPPSPAVPEQPMKADTAVAAPAATPASTTTVTEGAAPVATPASTTTQTEGAARVPAVVIKSTPEKDNLEDSILTNDEVKRLLSQGYTREKMANGNIQYCRKDGRTGSMISKKQCSTGGQLKELAEDKQQLNELMREKADVNPRPSSP
jgi:hypothetical protein